MLYLVYAGSAKRKVPKVTTSRTFPKISPLGTTGLARTRPVLAPLGGLTLASGAAQAASCMAWYPKNKDNCLKFMTSEDAALAAAAGQWRDARARWLEVGPLPRRGGAKGGGGSWRAAHSKRGSARRMHGGNNRKDGLQGGATRGGWAPPGWSASVDGVLFEHHRLPDGACERVGPERQSDLSIGERQKGACARVRRSGRADPHVVSPLFDLRRAGTRGVLRV